MASPATIREFRYLSSTTCNSNHSNAAESGWNCIDGTATKLQITDYDDGSLAQEGLEDETLQTRMYSKYAPHPGLSKGSYKITTYLTGAYSNTDATEEFGLLRDSLGGIANPTNARTSTATGGDSTNITCVSANTFALPGQAVMCGVKGDGRGNAECKIITNIDDGWLSISPACNAALSSGDQLVFSTTVYLDEDASQRYIDSVAIDHSTAGQRQTIGGVPKISLSGMAPGELPKIEMEVSVADHQYVPSTDRTSLSHGVTPKGGKPAHNKGVGMCFIGDHNVTTRLALKAGDLSADPGVVYEEVPSLSGVNGIEGYQRVKGTPTGEATVLIDEDSGLIDDFENRNNKTVIFQLGHTAQRTVAIEFPKTNLTALPTPTDINNLRGLKIAFQGTEDYVADNDLLSSAIRIHQF